MLRKLFRSRASKDVEVSMDYLLNFAHQNLVRSYFRQYPGFDTVIAEKHKEGVDTVVIAVELLANALTHTIENAGLSETERKAIEEFAVNGIGAGSDFGRALRAFLGNCGLQRDWNKIDETLFLYAITEPTGALRGLDRGERSNRRIMSAFQEVLLPTDKPSSA